MGVGSGGEKERKREKGQKWKQNGNKKANKKKKRKRRGLIVLREFTRTAYEQKFQTETEEKNSWQKLAILFYSLANLSFPFEFRFQFRHFIYRLLVADTQLFKRLFPFVGPLVRRSISPLVRWSIGPSVP